MKLGDGSEQDRGRFYVFDVGSLTGFVQTRIKQA